jgi:hypothetical protein
MVTVIEVVAAPEKAVPAAPQFGPVFVQAISGLHTFVHAAPGVWVLINTSSKVHPAEIVMVTLLQVLQGTVPPAQAPPQPAGVPAFTVAVTVHCPNVPATKRKLKHANISKKTVFFITYLLIYRMKYKEGFRMSNKALLVSHKAW